MFNKLKFRVWDKEKNMFFPIKNAMGMAIGDTDKFLYFLTNEGAFPIPTDSDRWIVQQTTTATDKNGKEIYEGDILNYRGRIGRVEFFASMYICCWDDQTDDELAYMMIGDIEIVGNVFQPPTIIETQVVVVEEEDENEDLSNCEQCGERAWDGRICHVCGMKDI